MNIESRKKKCCIWGFAGQRNFGDDLFARAIHHNLNAKNRELWVYGDPFSDLEREYSFKKLLLSKALPGINRLRTIIISRRIDEFVLGGGNLLDDETMPEMLQESPFFRRRSVLRIALGLGINTSRKQSHLRRVAMLLEKFSYVGFRDEDSYNWAKSLGLDANFALTEDLAFAWTSPREDVPTGCNEIGFALCAPKQIQYYNQNMKRVDEVFDEIVKSSVDTALRLDKKPVFFALCTNRNQNDAVAVRQSLRRLGKEKDAPIVEFKGSVADLEARMRFCASFVSMRLHGSISAFQSGIPLGVFSYHPKCTEFFYSLNADRRQIFDVADFDPANYCDFIRYVSLFAPKLMPGEERIRRARVNFHEFK